MTARGIWVLQMLHMYPPAEFFPKFLIAWKILHNDILAHLHQKVRAHFWGIRDPPLNKHIISRDLGKNILNMWITLQPTCHQILQNIIAWTFNQSTLVVIAVCSQIIQVYVHISSVTHPFQLLFTVREYILP